MPAKASSVGIDFGTGFASVGVRGPNGVEVIADSQGARATPCVVAFTDLDVVVGEAAVSQAYSNLKNTVYDISKTPYLALAPSLQPLLLLTELPTPHRAHD